MKKRILAALLAALMLAGVLSACGGGGGSSSYEKLVERYVNACQTGDPDAVINLISDKVYKAVVKSASEYGQKVSVSDVREMAAEEISSLSESAEMLRAKDKKWRLEYEITSAEKREPDRTYSEAGIEVESAMRAKLRVTVEVDGEELKLDTVQVGIVQIGGKWYLDAANYDDLPDELHYTVKSWNRKYA